VPSKCPAPSPGWSSNRHLTTPLARGTEQARVRADHDLGHSVREQANDFAHVAALMGGLDQSTQQNTALTELFADAAQSLRHQSQALAQTVSDFKL